MSNSALRAVREAATGREYFVLARPGFEARMPHRLRLQGCFVTIEDEEDAVDARPQTQGIGTARRPGPACEETC
jgi:hypothetical protein